MKSPTDKVAVQEVEIVLVESLGELVNENSLPDDFQESSTDDFDIGGLTLQSAHSSHCQVIGTRS